MKNDLISRSELKHHKFLSPDNPNATRFYDETTKAYQKGWNDAIDAIIDNAPTVELTEAEIQEVLNKRCMTAVANEYLIALHGKRQRGEWITVNFAPNELNCPEKSRFDFVKCPFCEVIHQGRHNFCSYCGADMREEGDT